MNWMPFLCDESARTLVGSQRTRVGIDIVQISRIGESIRRFGDRFLLRLFTADELAYASSVPTLMAQRLAARFAAKEAALKAFDLCEAGIDWRDMEVCRLPDDAYRLMLHGKAAAIAGASNNDIMLSLSHDGDYAMAVVAAPPATISSFSNIAVRS
ncbi:MAG: holo-ACP synthase [Burkholderiales bacterium]|jgi:holo-[acyl-carrier protein] synthase|nr:holo-ACP synthase [Burkholderiales bacterium]